MQQLWYKQLRVQPARYVTSRLASVSFKMKKIYAKGEIRLPGDFVYLSTMLLLVQFQLQWAYSREAAALFQQYAVEKTPSIYGSHFWRNIINDFAFWLSH